MHEVFDSGVELAATKWTEMLLRYGRSPDPLDGDRAIARAPPQPNVLFLCTGNICRSPFAERHLRERALSADVDSLSVRSAGFVRQEDRSSPGPAVRTAAEHDVDLSDHESTTVSRDLVAWSDVTFVMEPRHHVLARRRFGRGIDDVYLLNAFRDGDGFEIPDPITGDEDAFRRVYDSIAAANEAFLTALESSDE